ncbi:MAG: cytochrome c biogenesis protein CcsA [Bryobacterales bacterium]|nr:cytochrome c biogenesis protein [Bryobacteraceae bacterium]MDW8130880.1 cytochrome c biogenesis protein CcsA [Bryobacterales bacterium]
MSTVWLRAAAGLYSLGLVHALLLATRRTARLFPLALGAFTVGVVLHAVSLVEQAVLTGRLPANNFFQSASLCGLLSALLFLFVWWRYRARNLCMFIFPLVFVLTLIGALGSPLGGWSDQSVREAWLLVHVALVLAGYAALLVSAVASLAYLIRERQLKRKLVRCSPGDGPALMTLDELIGRGLTLGFVFITLGLVAATTWAAVESGTRWIRDPRILISLGTWALYLVLVFLRATGGLRGRKAAMMVVALVGCSALTWAAHTGLRHLLLP